jgi:hypothetical protein
VVSTVSCYPVEVLKVWTFTYRRKNVWVFWFLVL